MAETTEDLLRKILKKLTQIEKDTAKCAKAAEIFTGMKTTQGDAMDEMLRETRKFLDR